MIEENARKGRPLRKTLAIGGVVAVVGALTIGPAFATQPFGNDYLNGTIANPYVEDGHMVTICHRTGSESNPYVIITVDVAAIDGQEANDHDGHDQVGNGPIGDVIPPVVGYNDDGKNWNDNWEPGDSVSPDLCVAQPS
jgi:hypothetical protein